MAAIQPVITDAGLGAVWNAQNTGMQAEIAFVALGSGAWTAAEADPNTGILSDVTALRNEELRIPIAGGSRVDEHTIKVSAVADDDSEFWVSELAFVLSDGTILAIAVFPSRPLAWKASDTPLLLGFDLSLVALPADSVTIIAGTPDINLSVATELAALAAADIQHMNSIVSLNQRVSAIENTFITPVKLENRLALFSLDVDRKIAAAIEGSSGGYLVSMPTITGPTSAQPDSAITLIASATSLLVNGSIASFNWTLPDSTTQTTPAASGSSSLSVTLTGNIGDTKTISVKAIDNAGNQSASTATSITLTSNAVPDITNLVHNFPQSIKVGETLTGMMISGATDPDGDPITYALSLPIGITASKVTGITDNEPFTLTAASNMTVGQTAIITIIARDGRGGEAQKMISMVIASAETPIGPGTVINGDIVVGELNGYWILAAPATKRALRRWGLYDTDTTLPNITSTGTPDPNSGTYNTDVLTSATYANINDGYGSIGAPAAKFCRDQGYDLPNKEELNLIYQNRAAIDAADTSGGTATLAAIAASTGGTSWVWSSTENSSRNAWIQRVSDGYQGGNVKVDSGWVVPLRRISV